MNSDNFISAFSNKLEDAGILGITAGSILGALLLLDDNFPASVSGTDQGFVWSGQSGSNNARNEFDIGIGKIVVEDAAFSATLGVFQPDDRLPLNDELLFDSFPSHISFMISFLGDGNVPAVFLELSPKIAVWADKVMGAEANENKGVIGYENPGETVKIPLAFTALEFTFKFDIESGVHSSVNLFNGGLNPANAIDGIFALDMDKVMVFPKLADLGLYIDEFFIDFSSNAASSISGLFPEVYDPSWKGLGAKEITLLFPVDDNEFISAGVQGFLVGFDGLFSGSFNFDYANLEPGSKIKSVHAGVEIRNNEFIKAEANLGWDLRKAIEQVETDAPDATETGGSAEDEKLAQKTQDQRADAESTVSFDGLILFEVNFVWLETEEQEVLGFDLIATGVAADGEESGLTFTNDYARYLFWSLGGVTGLILFIKGIKDGSEKPFAIGSALLLLVLADIIYAIEDNGPAAAVLELKKLSIKKLGFRYFRTAIGGLNRNFYDIILGFQLEFGLDGGLIIFLKKIANAIGKGVNSGEIFGMSHDSLKLAGGLDLEFDNFLISFDSTEAGDDPEEIANMRRTINTLFEQKDLALKARKIPEIQFTEESGGDGWFPMPITSAELVIQEKEGSNRKDYGLAIKLQGLTTSAVKVDTPAVGVVIFFYPEFDIKFLPQLDIKPQFTFLIPKVVYAEGVIDINHPIPSFEGTQNRISLEVGVTSTKPEEELKEQFKLENYKYRFGGEVAWGEARHPITDKEFDFLFVEVHYDGNSPLIVIGPIGLYGLGLIFGRNIRPGVSGDQGSAMGIANWITGAKSAGGDPFGNIRDWPDVPSDSTWHPYTTYDETENTHSSQFAIGLTVKVGSPADAGESYKGEVVVLVGFPEFWLAIAGIIEFKKINSKLTVVIVYDRDTFAIKFIFEIKVDKDGSIVAGKIPLEFGTVKDPKQTWFYLGHYSDSKGGPVVLQFLKGIFSVKAYIVYDSKGLPQFGILPFDDFSRPDLPARGFGFGALFQIGPKKYGPGWANVELFAALGFNVAKSTNPRMVFGEFYAGGYIRAKFLFIKLQFELLLILSGLATDNGHRFIGVIKFKINLPWPIPDKTVEFDCLIQSNNFVPLPDTEISSTAAGLRRLAPQSIELFTDSPPIMPIDGAVSIAFDKPIYELLNPGSGTLDQTSLLLNGDNFDEGVISEIIETEYQGIKYVIHYSHILEDVVVERRPIGLGVSTVVQELAASWGVPQLYENGTVDPTEKQQHTLFLNALFPPNLQFSPEQLGAYNEWELNRDRVFPCVEIGQICLFNLRQLPSLDPQPAPHFVFKSFYGDVTIREDKFANLSIYSPQNIGRLGWSTDGTQTMILPLETSLEVPLISAIELPFQLAKLGNGYTFDFSGTVDYLRVIVEIRLRGKANPYKIELGITPDSGAAPCHWVINQLNIDIDNDLLDFVIKDPHCDGLKLFNFNLNIEAKDAIHPIKSIKIKGPTVFLNSKLIVDWHTYIKEFGPIIAELFQYFLRLRNLCIDKNQNWRTGWLNTTANGSSQNPEDAVNDFTNFFLLEPNHIYTINYCVRTFASIYHIKDDDDSDTTTITLVGEKDPAIKVLTTPLDDKMRSISFRTEERPSQNIEKYLGFTFPTKGMQAPYPDATVPMLTFKYQGLIRKIYAKHFGSDVLRPLLVDMSGEEVAPFQTGSFSMHSSGADASLEDLLEHCLPNTQDYVKLRIETWRRDLKVDTAYSLQLKDTSADLAVVPYTISFTTSRYQNLTEHVGAVNSLFQTPSYEPVLDSTDFGSQLSQFFADLQAGAIPSHDEAVEQFYRRLLGQDGGRLGGSGTANYAGLIVALNQTSTTTETQVWGAVIELQEPLIGKEGVLFETLPNTSYLAEKGILLMPNGYCLLHDLSGSRVIILKTTDLNTFEVLPSNVALDCQFDFSEALRHSIATYVNLTFLDKTDTAKADAIADALIEAKTNPDIQDALTVIAATLNFSTSNIS